jgi:hypothetical protein
VDVRIVHTLHQYPKWILVQWTVNAASPSAVTFSIERSGSPGGPWLELANGLLSVYYTDTFEDAQNGTSEASLWSVTREIWYRVKATDASGRSHYSPPTDTRGNEQTHYTSVQAIGLAPVNDTASPLPATTFSKGSGIDKRLQLVQNNVIRRSMVALRHFSGVEVAVLKRKHYGERCTVCFDHVTKHVLVSNCLSCFGTGWTGGYYPAFITLGRVTESPTSSSLESAGTTEIIRAKIDTIDFPRIEIEDVLVEIDSNRRWEVNAIDISSLRRRRVLQFCTCTEVASTSIKYKVPVTSDSLMELPHV